jgi:hypothetical protein
MPSSQLQDLTLMAFFLWEYLKQMIYAVPPRTIENHAASLQTAMTVVDANMLRHV